MSKFEFDSAFPKKKKTSWWKTGLKILGWTVFGLLALLTAYVLTISLMFDMMWH